MVNVMRNTSRAIGTIWAVVILLTYASPLRADDLPRRGSLGVVLAPIPNTLRAKLSVPAGQGVLAQGLIADGPAQKAGIFTNDVILKVDNTKIQSVPQLLSLLRNSPVGSTLRLELWREGQRLSKTVTVQPRPHETSPDFDILYRTVVVDDTLRRVIVTKPRAAGRHPAVLFVTGMSCFSQDGLTPEMPGARLLYPLTQDGMVTMRVEKSGMGDSEGPSCESPQVDLNAEVRGYLAGLRALKTYDFVDHERVFILGLSIGGIVGPLVANQEPVQGLIVAETVGTSWFEYELANLRRQLVLKGTPYDEVDHTMGQKRDCMYRLLIDQHTPEQILQAAPSCAPFLDYPAPYTYLQQVAALNLAEVWKPLDVPVLVIYGTSDFITSAEEHRYLTHLINSFHPGRARFVQIDEMDHYLLRAASMRKSMARTGSGEFHAAFLAEVRQWLEERLTQKGKE